MIFEQVDPSFKVEWMHKDGDLFMKLMADAAYPARILETRKTATGLRLVDKWAVVLSDTQDNHISAAGGIMNALKSVDAYLKQKNLEMDVEKVERRTLEEVLEYVSGSKTRLARTMLENIVVPLEKEDVDITMLRDAVELISGRVETEASGNVTIETVYKIGQSGVTFISRSVNAVEP
ncbi:hypothetical protein Bca4012_013591 [Brassica carinata]